jgi:hypothetical protein
MLPHELPGIKPRPTAERTPAEVAADLKTVAMVFPRPVQLTLTHGETVNYPAGQHDVPEVLARHWYLKASGARPVADQAAE